jgi:hypothetical protein
MPMRRLDQLSFKYLRVRSTDQSSVVWLYLPWQPWRKREASQERAFFLKRLVELLPCQLLSLDEVIHETAPADLWLDRETSMSALEPMLEEGHWVMLFFEEKRQGEAVSGGSSSYPEDAAAALAILNEAGARAGIWSLPDDIEWVVAHR